MNNAVEIKCYTESDMKYHISQMKRYGYKKVSDCMWALIFEKDNSTVVLNREY